jgi:hypothetical protein
VCVYVWSCRGLEGGEEVGLKNGVRKDRYIISSGIPLFVLYSTPTQTQKNVVLAPSSSYYYYYYYYYYKRGLNATAMVQRPSSSPGAP